MRDTLLETLVAIRNTQANIIKRIDVLERRQRDATGQMDRATRTTTQGLCRPTEPPSKYIAYERGVLWWYALASGYVDEIIPYGWERELAYPVGLGVDAFTNAGYYRWGICGLDFDSSWNAWLYESADEWEHPDVAIADFWDMVTWAFLNIFDGLSPSYSGDVLFPLAAILFRNDGTTGSTGKILPITLNDRSQSSFIARDFRPNPPVAFIW